MSDSYVLALIPARSGSRGIPNKNVRLLAGKPLLAHTVEQALAANNVTRTIVSTDSEEYARIAAEYGAEVPFLRPAGLSGDLSTDHEVFVHALEWLDEHDGKLPEACVHLRPTHPVRRVVDIDEAIRMLLDDPTLDSIRSVIPAPASPYKMWRKTEEGLLRSVSGLAIPGAHSLPRQMLPQAYLQNAAIDVVRTSVVLEHGSMTGNRIKGFFMEEEWDIDTEADFRAVEDVLRRRRAHEKAAGEREAWCFASTGRSGEKTFCFDIDGVIATLVEDNDYRRAEPRPEVIEVVNALHGRGHRIVLHTARGSATGVDWESITRRQMERWGVRFDELVFGKPAADHYIDDRLFPLENVRDLLAE